jgi:hypothetical protein
VALDHKDQKVQQDHKVRRAMLVQYLVQLGLLVLKGRKVTLVQLDQKVAGLELHILLLTTVV